MSSEPFSTFQITLTAQTADIPNKRRVKLSPTGVSLSASVDQSVGVTTRLGGAIGDDISINTTGSPSGIYTSAVAIAVGDKVYGAADGKVALVATGEPIGVALTATTAADQDVAILHVTLV